MNEAPDFVLFLGRFHPLVVHLPIGFLIFAFLLEIIGRKEKFKAVTSAVPLALFLGFLSAVIACILGYMLSYSGDYDEGTLDTHFWFGIATPVVTLIAWLIRTDRLNLKNLKTVKANISILTLIVILISITGHYGGNLTHGSDYLVKYLPFGNKDEAEMVEAVSKIEDAIVYSHLVNPILQNKCTSCHNTDKKKGGLMLHDSVAIMKGGKNGDVIISGNSGESELIRRVLLEPHHDDFMPPEGKTPLTEEEIAVLQYWIDNANANFSAKIASTETPDAIRVIASSKLGISGGTHKKGNTNLPVANKIDETILKDLIAEGFTVKELVFDSNLYEVNLPSYSKAGSEDINVKLEKLSKIRDNIVWLYIEDNQLADKHLKAISTFSNLQKLVINKNEFTDEGIIHLKALENLNSLNVYDNQITSASLKAFSEFKNLEKVYAFQTSITEADLKSYAVNENYPEIIIAP